jgi:Tfp pilus assembly protein FimT
MAFIAIVGAFTMLVSMDSYRGYTFHTERDVLIAALQHARAQAVGNVCLGAGCTTGKAHGVYIQPDKFVIFQGSSYATRDTAQDSVIPAATSVLHSGISEVVFSELSGNSSTPGTISVSANGRTSDITIGALGQIVWTN